MTVEQALDTLDPFGSGLIWRRIAVIHHGGTHRAVLQWELVDPATMNRVFVHSIADDLHYIVDYVDQIVEELLGDHSWRQISQSDMEQTDWAAGDKADLRRWLTANLRLLE